MLGRVAVGVDLRGAGAGALADQVDAVVAERAAGVLEVVDALGQRVAVEVEPSLGQPVGAVLKPRAEARSAWGRAGRSARGGRRVDLRAVEPGRAVDAAVADEHDVVVAVKRLAALNSRFVMPGPPSRRKIGSAGCLAWARMRVTGTAIRRELRVVAVLGHDQRAAVGRSACLARWGTRRGAGRQLAGAGAVGDGDGRRRRRRAGSRGEDGRRSAPRAAIGRGRTWRRSYGAPARVAHRRAEPDPISYLR